MGHGGDIYRNKIKLDYSVNTNPFGVSEEVKSALKEAVERVGQYPDVRCEELKKYIGEKEGIEENLITCGNGAAELLYSIVLAYYPKHTVLTDLAFSEYARALSTINCETVYYPLKEEMGFQIDEAYLDFLQEKKTNMVILCSPNNPNGAVLEKSIFQKIAEYTKEKDILLVVDECFIEFVEGYENESVKSFLKSNPQMILLKAFTKIYAMPGVRLGYAMSSNQEIIQKIESVRQAWNVSIFAQEAGIAAIKSGYKHEKLTSHIAKERVYLKEKLEELGCKVFPSKVNFLLFYTEIDFYNLLLEEGILIRDCSDYHGLKKGYYRIAIKLHEENEELIRHMQKITTKRRGDNTWQNQL